jgi:HK97 family phage major capsid protein
MPARYFRRDAHRTSHIDRSKVDGEKRTIELAFSSEAPVERWGENEVLSHEKGDYDFARLNDSHPLLLGHNEHDPKTQIGVIESARVDGDKVGRAVVRFGTGQLASEIFEDVKGGIRKLVSVGYNRTGIVESKKAPDGMMTTRYRWEPSHIAIVPVPADTNVGIGRSKKRLCPDCGGAGTCQECDGDGEDTEGGRCDHCNGNGRCADCGGNGYISTAKSNESVDTSKIDNAKRANQHDNKSMRILLDPKSADGGSPTAAMTPEERTKIEEGAINRDLERRKKIRSAADALGAQFKNSPGAEKEIRALADKAIDERTSVEDFNVTLLQAIPNVRKCETTDANIGMTKKETRGYSILRAIRSCMENNGDIANDCPEFDYHQEAEKRYQRRAGSFWIPADVVVGPRGDESPNGDTRGQRDLQVNVFGQGGAFVQTTITTPIIEILRNKMVLKRAGIQIMGGLTGNPAIPRQTGAATAYSLSEIAALTLSTQTIDQVLMTPHRVGATNNYSKELLIQSSIDVENFMRSDMMEVTAIQWDALGFNGAGGAQPTGIFSTAGVGSITFGGAATFANCVLMETQLNAANAMGGKRAYITSPTAKGKLKSAAKLLVGATTVAAYPIWDGGGEDGEINGYLALDTNNIQNNAMVFGNWQDLIMGLFGGFDVVVDPYTLAKNAEVVITVNTFGDYAVRHPVSFCVSSDSAAQ